jgi:hypothetical protein
MPTTTPLGATPLAAAPLGTPASTTPSQYVIGVDPSTGMLTLNGETLSRNDPRLWGARGLQQQQRWERTGEWGTDSGPGIEDIGPSEYWNDLQSRGLVQLGSAGVSSGEEGQGFGELNINAINNGLVEYDPEYGIVVRDASLIDDPNDPDDRARMNRWRNAMFAAMAAGVGAGLTGTEGLFGSAAPVELGSATTGVDVLAPAFDTLATAGGSGASAGGSFLSQLPQGVQDIYSTISNIPSGISDFVSNLGSSGPAQLGDPANYAPGQFAGGGGGMGNSFLSGILGDTGLGYGDLFRGAMGLIGTGLNVRQGRENQQLSREEAERNRQLQREVRFTNQETPYGNSRWTQDPVTGRWTQTATLNPEDQARLETLRRIAAQRQQRAQEVPIPAPMDFRAWANNFLPPSLGGNYLGGR